jgi:hypothetical protein
MGYRVRKDIADGYNITEVNEGETKDIAHRAKEDAARKLQKHLNTGGGFDGFTPDFFLQKAVFSV